MREIKVTVSTRYVGSEDYDTFEVEDDTTDEEINKIAYEVMHELIEWNWEENPELLKGESDE